MRCACRAVSTAGLVALFIAAAPAPAAAQTNAAIAAHVGRTAALPGGALVGVAGELGRGPLALRTSVGVDAAGTPFGGMLSEGRATSGLWTVDADAGLALGRLPVLDRVVGRMNPTVFAGLGVVGQSGGDALEGASASGVVPTWSWGARTSLPLVSWLSIEAEARHRSPLDDASVDDFAQDGWEYRAGLALRFGGRAARASAPRPSGPRRGGTVGGRGTSSDRATRTIGTRDERRAASAAEIADNAIGLAERYVGTPYVWGGESPDGFDCSGFVQYVYRRQGIELPRVSRDQARAGRSLPTSLDGIARGDLLFFAGDGRTVSHVAIYAGDGRILHSSSAGRGVRYDDLRASRGGWYVNHLVGVRRVIDDGYTWSDSYAEAAPSASMPARSMSLDAAFEAIAGDD